MAAANAINYWTSTFGGSRAVSCRGEGSNGAALQHWGQRCLPPVSAKSDLRHAAEYARGQNHWFRHMCIATASVSTPSSIREQSTNRQSPSSVGGKKRSAAVGSTGSSFEPSEILVRPSAPSAARLMLLERQALHDSASNAGDVSDPPSSQWPRQPSSAHPSSQWPRQHSAAPPSSRWPQQRPVRAAILADLPQDVAPTASGRGPAKRPQDLGNPLGREATLARALSALPSSADYGTVLRGEELSGPAITRLLSCMKSQGGASRSLDVFNWLDAEGYPTRDCYVLSRLMSMLGSTRALHLFERLTGAGLQPDLACFNAAINFAGKARRWKLVEELQVQMRDAGVEGDVVTYTTLISASQACGRWDAAQQHWAAMQAAGIKPTVISLTTMMSASNKAGHWQYALQLFDQLASDAGSAEQRRQLDIIPDVVLFNAAITACASGAAWERAWAIFSDMRLRQVQPNARSYNALLSACERAGQTDRVLEVFKNMKRRAAGHWGYIDPNLVTYNTLLSSCAKAGRYDEAMGVYEEMQQRGLEPDSYTLTALLTASERVGNWRQAQDVFDDFSARHIPIISCNYNSLIYTLATGGEWQKALDVLQRMRDDTNVQLDAISYSSGIIACARGGCCEEALQLLEDMQSAGHQPSGYTYAILIEMCETAGEWSRVVELVQSMQEDDIDPVLAHRVMYAPLLQTLLPDPLLSALRATVATGRAARRWIERT